jgi:hypothetical protein
MPSAISSCAELRRDDTLPVVMTGSHLDTQPTGGKFDGILRRARGARGHRVLERARARDAPSHRGRRVVQRGGLPLSHGHDGLGGLVGALPLGCGLRADRPRGHQRAQRTGALGVAPASALQRQAVKAALEVHIEQGPVLEQRENHRRRHRRAAHEPPRGHRHGPGGACRTHAHGPAPRSRPRARRSLALAPTRQRRPRGRTHASRWACIETLPRVAQHGAGEIALYLGCAASR